VFFSSPAEIFGMDGVIVLVVVALVLFGSTQIPKLARSLGSAQKEFKQGLAEGDSGKAATPAGPVVPAVVVSTPAPVVTEAPPGATVHTA
jgi:sec-independent protein translocase protein TatA